MRPPLRTAPLVILIPVLLLCSLTLQSCADEPPKPKDDGGRPIKILTLGGSQSGWHREYPGTIAAAQEVQLGFEVPGKVIEFPAKGGERIEAGALIAKLDQTSFVANLTAAQAKAESSSADLEPRSHKENDIGCLPRHGLFAVRRPVTV